MVITPPLSAGTSRDLRPVLEQGWPFLQLTFLCVLGRARLLCGRIGLNKPGFSDSNPRTRAFACAFKAISIPILGSFVTAASE